MSKRFTETSKWADPWFRALNPTRKALWQWMLDNCDCGGVLPEIDWALASFQIGAPVGEADLVAFEGRLEPCGKGYWLTKFVAFQVGYIDPEHPSMPQRGVIKALERASIPLAKAIERVSKPFPKGSQTLKDKDKDKDKDKEEGVQRKEKDAPVTDEQWLAGLAKDPAFAGLDVNREFAKMSAWCSVNRKQPSRRRFVNWLNRAERPMAAPGAVTQDTFGSVRPGLEAW